MVCVQLVPFSVHPSARPMIACKARTPQVNTPSTPSTSKREIAKAKRLKALLSAIGANGSNLRALMESMQRKDRKGFVSTYIVPNIEAGYIAMLYPEAPNHPMQSYYLTKKGRELLEQL